MLMCINYKVYTFYSIYCKEPHDLLASCLKRVSLMKKKMYYISCDMWYKLECCIFNVVHAIKYNILICKKKKTCLYLYDKTVLFMFQYNRPKNNHYFNLNCGVIWIFPSPFLFLVKECYPKLIEYGYRILTPRYQN